MTRFREAVRAGEQDATLLEYRDHPLAQQDKKLRRAVKDTRWERESVGSIEFYWREASQCIPAHVGCHVTSVSATPLSRCFR